MAQAKPAGERALAPATVGRRVLAFMVAPRASGEAQLAHHAGGGGEAVVGGDEREPAAGEVAVEQVDEERLPGIVERGERLVEDPELGGVEREAGQPDAAALPGGQAPRRQAAALLEADGGERLAALLRRGGLAPRRRSANSRFSSAVRSSLSAGRWPA